MKAGEPGRPGLGVAGNGAPAPCVVHACPRDVLWVHGADAVSFLQGQCTQDVVARAAGETTGTLVLEPDGKLGYAARVTRVGPEEVLVDVESGFGEGLLGRLRRFAIRTRCTFESQTWTMTSFRGEIPGRPWGVAGASELGSSPLSWIEGPDGSGAVARAGDGWPVALVAHVGSPGWPGLDVVAPEGSEVARAVLEATGAVPVSRQAWEAARIEAGVPAMASELVPGTLAAETGLLADTVSFTKGCYTGQELVERMASRGAAPPRRLAVVEVAGTAGRAGEPPEGASAPGEPLEDAWAPGQPWWEAEPDRLVGAGLWATGPPSGPDRPAAAGGPVDPGATGARPAGTITSAAWSARRGRVVALAFVGRALPTPGDVLVGPRDAGGAPEWLLVGTVRDARPS